MRVAIVGAGVCGFALAAALRQKAENIAVSLISRLMTAQKVAHKVDGIAEDLGTLDRARAAYAACVVRVSWLLQIRRSAMRSQL